VAPEKQVIFRILDAGNGPVFRFPTLFAELGGLRKEG